MVAQTLAVSEQIVSDIDIIDIRRDRTQHSLLDDIFNGVSAKKDQEKHLPTLLLYDEAGLKLFEEITYLEQYYLTNAEINALNTHAHAIAKQIEPGSMVIELGSGNLRKVNILLQALEKAQKSVEYYALDLSLPELKRTLSAIPEGTYKYVKCFGLHGTYEDGLYWLEKSRYRPKPKCILSLGSSIGNFDRKAAARFLKSFAYNLHGNDRIIIGLDACKDSERVFHAYNDREGITHQFVLNGLLHANRLIGMDVFDLQQWKVIGEWDESAGRHQAFYSPLEDVKINGCVVNAGEKVRVEESYKYSTAESDRLWDTAGLVKIATYGNERNDYNLHMLARPPVSFPLKQDVYAASPVPTLTDWKGLWTAWDTVTTCMIPKDELLSKPIKLRNACVFYLGHIPTFLDMQLSAATRQPSTEPAYYTTIFERGIDPDVDNPGECHSHSEIPDNWPPLEEILDFQDRVRERVKAFYHKIEAHSDSKLGRALWLGFEHELMHLETLLYMLLQSDKTIPPPGPHPNFKDMARQAELQAIPNQWVAIPESNITLGMNDPENEFGPNHYFGWDNEKPLRSVKVHPFVAKARPISNEDYALFLAETRNPNIPMSWSGDSSARQLSEANGHSKVALNGDKPHENGGSVRLSNAYLRGKSVKTVYGFVPLEYTLDWPVMASYDELAACAKWMNGRIPTLEEVRSIYSYVDKLKTEEAEKVLGRTISAVNGHLVNEGVEETPPPHPSRKLLPTGPCSSAIHQLFTDLEGCNVGFQNWHPTPITQNGDKLSGQGGFGGVWEWTSSVLKRHDGFEAMHSYPGYTADFSDGKHNVMLGGSWATHPRIAGRKTFVNWYQRNYPYAWAGARLVHDA